MAQFIVTIKLPRNPAHNPAEKQTGPCPVSPSCTDVTGQHHSYLTEAESERAARTRAEFNHGHVTRIEAV
jgi:hypothetical protein